jgi:hypothetical protein
MSSPKAAAAKTARRPAAAGQVAAKRVPAPPAAKPAKAANGASATGTWTVGLGYCPPASECPFAGHDDCLAMPYCRWLEPGCGMPPLPPASPASKAG